MKTGIPGYKQLSPAQFQEKIDRLREGYHHCVLCPRQCGALRAENEAGVCRALRDVKIASYNLHHGEEPPISGQNGSGTLFFSGCTLKCKFCQNYPISHLFNGTFYTIAQLAGLMIYLQDKGAHNINLVSPTPYLYHFAAALQIAAQKGLTIPIAYNTSGYERPEIIRLLDGLVDVYMPDIKYIDEKLSKKFSNIDNYLEHALPTVEEMFRQVGPLVTDQNDMAQKGLIIRHLILPGEVSNSLKVLEKIRESRFKDCHLSLMSQYFPAYKAADVSGIERRLLPEEYKRVKDYALHLGFNNGWFQDM